jgi:hypothetical protein
MRFEYEITADDFAASQICFRKLTTGRSLIKRSLGWILSGLTLIVVAWTEQSANWMPILLASIGIWWIYSGTQMLFPRRYYRRAYPASELGGKTFEAEVDEQGLTITGKDWNCHLQWPAVVVKGENEEVIVFYGTGTIFMFGKRYLTHDQLEELRRLSGSKIAV